MKTSAAKVLARKDPKEAPCAPSNASPGIMMGTSAPWRRRAVSEAVALNVAVAVIDLDSVIVVVSSEVWRFGGGGEFDVPTDLMENCDGHFLATRPLRHPRGAQASEGVPFVHTVSSSADY